MTKKVFFNLLLTIIAFNTYSQGDTLRVLFLGNSYTSANNLPQITQSLAAAAGKTLIIDSNTPGGNTLEQHSINTTSLNKIMLGNWDFVILQEQSQIPTIDFYRYNSMYPGANRLNDTIKKYNSCAQVVMYQTWGRRFGGQQCDPSGMNCSPVFVDFTHMQDSLEAAYDQLARNMDAYIAPVGIAWKKVIEDTTIVLHTADNSHPNYNGSYLAACVFHSVLWNESPVGLTYTGTLSNVTAAYLQLKADSTVFHSYSNWNLNVDSVAANFSYTMVADTVNFNNLSQNLAPASYLWNFGDGMTSTAENPTHLYASNQTYTVTLIVEYCSSKDTIFQPITINALGTEEIKLESVINVFPNPVNSYLEIKVTQERVSLEALLYNSNGFLIMSNNRIDHGHVKFNLKFLPTGLYFLRLMDKQSNKQATFKVVKR